MKNAVCFFSLMVVLLGCITSSIAKIDITPSVTLREEYNDNIFLSKSNKVFDYITKISPAVLLEYSPGRTLDLSLDYRLDFRLYSRNRRFNDTSLKDTQNMNLKAQARPMNRLFIDVTDIYKRVPIDIRKKVAVDNALRNMTDNNVFTISPYIDLPLSSSLSTKFGYTYNNIWYKSDKNVDSESHLAFITLTDRLSSKLSGELRYDYYKYLPSEQRTFKLLEDYDKQSGSIGLTYQLGSNITLKGQVGESYFNFTTRENTNNSFWSINADYDIRAATSLGAGYSTILNDSSTGGVYKRHKFDMYFKTERPVKFTINPYRTRDEYLSASDREDSIYGANASIVYPLTSKIDILLDGLWERQKFLPEDEKVHKYSIGSSVDYRLTSKVTSNIGYRYNNSNSNVDSKDYKNNIVWLQAKVVF